VTAEPGDFLLIKTHHFASRLIRFGQRGYPEADRQWNHVALYVGDGKIVEALTKGVVISFASKYLAADVQLVHPTGSPEERCHAAAFATSCAGEKYGWLTIANLAVKVLTKGKIDLSHEGTTICSGLVARSLERMGYNFNPYDPAELTPAYLAKELG
jgi:cell wall-associated NlpC family hydrolase